MILVLVLPHWTDRPGHEMLSSLSFVALLCTLVSGTPLPRNMQVHEARQSIPAGFTLHAPASPDTVLSLRVALVQNDPDGLVNALYDVSTPSGANYGQYLSKDEVWLFSSSQRADVDVLQTSGREVRSAKDR